MCSEFCFRFVFRVFVVILGVWLGTVSVWGVMISGTLLGGYAVAFGSSERDCLLSRVRCPLFWPLLGGHSPLCPSASGFECRY